MIGYAEYDESIYYSKAIHVANKIAEMQNFRTHLDAEDEYILIMGPREKDLEADVKNLADCFKMYKWSSVTNKFELYKNRGAPFRCSDLITLRIILLYKAVV